MSQFIDIIQTAYNPDSEQFQSARNQLIEMRDSTPQLLLATINETFQGIETFSEQSLLYLIIFSRECFSSTCQFQPEILQQYESILLVLMRDSRENVRYHSSISLGVYSVFRAQLEINFLSQLFQNIADLNDNFYFSFEIAILYLIKEIDLSSSQHAEIFNFIFPRIVAENSPNKEKFKCLQILFYQSQYFIDFLNESDYSNLIQLLLQMTTIPEFSQFIYRIWSEIAFKRPESFTNELFTQLLDISLTILSSIPSDHDSFLLKTEIFKFLAFSLPSEFEIDTQILPKLIELSLANFYPPSLIENDTDNILYDCLNSLLVSLQMRFPQETTELFSHFIETFLSDENPNNQYTALTLYLLLLNNEFDPTQSPQMIQIALSSEMPQMIIRGLDILLYVASNYHVQMIDQIDFLSFLPLCINYLKSENTFLIKNSSFVIIKIISIIKNIDNAEIENYKSFNAFSIIQEIMELITNSPHALYIELLTELIDYFNDLSELMNIYEFAFLLSTKLFENKMINELSSTCRLFSALFKQFSSCKFQFPVDEAKNLFAFFVGLQNTEIGDDVVDTIGDMAYCMKDDFNDMIETAYQITLDNIDRNQFVRSSLACITKLLIAVNSSVVISEIYKRLALIIEDLQSFGQDFTYSFDILKVLLFFYYDYLISDQNGIELLSSMIKYFNVATQNLNEFVKNDKETAVELSVIIFRSYSRLIDKDATNFFPMFSQEFFFIVSFLIDALYDEDNDGIIPASIPAVLICTIDILVKSFGHELKQIFEYSNIIQFLSSFLSSEDQNEKIVSIIKQIFTNIGFTSS